MSGLMIHATIVLIGASMVFGLGIYAFISSKKELEEQALQETN